MNGFPIDSHLTLKPYFPIWSFETHEIPTVSVLRHLRENGPLLHVPTRGPESRITAGNSGRFTVLQEVNRYFPFNLLSESL